MQGWEGGGLGFGMGVAPACTASRELAACALPQRA